jgi:hypothetical protein
MTKLPFNDEITRFDNFNLICMEPGANNAHRCKKRQQQYRYLFFQSWARAFALWAESIALPLSRSFWTLAPLLLGFPDPDPSCSSECYVK